MTSTRGRLDLFVAATVLAMLIGVALSRTLAMADHSQHRALATEYAHFVAGIGMLQAESRIAQRRKLNAMGYPTGRSGALQDDADCDFIWREVMQEGGHRRVSRFTADSDGGGDRCEFLVIGTTAESSMRILYWPLGARASTVALGRDTIRLTRGVHIYVEPGEVSP